MREITRGTEERYTPHVDEIQEKLAYYKLLEDFTVVAPSRKSNRRVNCVLAIILSKLFIEELIHEIKVMNKLLYVVRLFKEQL